MIAMSYMRSPYPLKYFYGITESYVFPTSDGAIEDYGDDYHNNPSFIELIGRFVKSATGDEIYSEKIIKILAKKLGCDHLLRDHPITYDERIIENKMLQNVSSGKVWELCSLLENIENSRFDWKDFDFIDSQTRIMTRIDIEYESYLVYDAFTTHITLLDYALLYGVDRLDFHDIREFVKSFYDDDVVICL